ncbi:DEAD/DEAH box helicase [Vibrio fluvialis]|uniref:DEAD/DEAH box helicase n=1 Tax=Vibrio fluvialis TaxID=676 RepID=UPI00192C5C5B|nr:ATP-binding domain-containing protein [Vibrio fluvialis]ELS8947693.1 DEAD/DEAH box helicase [Vibrio fluvialis]MBL4287153.1 AAA family ATPase [Vibrio fluvialis]MBL4291428.1 AAA family ATPase [Vibrio fluvialis]
MSNSFFYLQAEQNELNSQLISELKNYATTNMKQMYVIDRPLGDNKYSYDCENVLVLLMPEHKITFINIGEPEGLFLDFVEDFIEDLGSISDKYRYKDEIGRPRSWRQDLIDTASLADIDDEFFDKIKLTEPSHKRRSELLISLLTGSINDISKVKTDISDNILDIVKHKILLFDGDQTRFIYQKPTNSVTRIQGLSGTGKTELLLHKLKEIYVDESIEDSKIMFTCHNHILASDLRKRIPDFFDFMKVEQQILWNERLWCVNAWGSASDRNSGAYRYICDFYDIPFLRYSRSNTFDRVCTLALSQIESHGLIDKHGHAFDFILLDESQDFPESFIKLCKIVTKHHLYVAGDIFQSIFDEQLVSQIEPDFLLSKCYRTDPRTLMFAHSLGMGLFETPKLRWLEEPEWKACGYQPNVEGEYQVLTREPLRRFADIIDASHASVDIVPTSAEKEESAETKIIEIIHKIREEHPTVTVNDIGIIFIDNANYVYTTADKLFFSIKREFGWTVNKAYESKINFKNQLFVSNKNNVKGLEFPFVICVTKKITSNQSYRNALYMMLTRSFLKSYLLINKETNEQLIGVLNSELDKINKTGTLRVKIPSIAEKEQIRTTIKYTEVKKSFYDSVHELFDEYEVPYEARPQLYKIITQTTKTFKHDIVCKVIEFNMTLPLGD